MPTRALLASTAFFRREVPGLRLRDPPSIAAAFRLSVGREAASPPGAVRGSRPVGAGLILRKMKLERLERTGAQGPHRGDILDEERFVAAVVAARRFELEIGRPGFEHDRDAVVARL
jgi:hypothetical protein